VGTYDQYNITPKSAVQTFVLS